MIGLEVIATITGIIVGTLSFYIAANKWMTELRIAERKAIEERAINEINQRRDVGHLRRDLEQSAIRLEEQIDKLESIVFTFAKESNERIRLIELQLEKLSAKMDLVIDIKQDGK